MNAPALTVQLAPGADGTSWRHALSLGEARAGWVVGPERALLRRLGAILGDPVVAISEAERVAAYAEAMDAHDDGTRSYSAARSIDAFGVARYVLGLRDRLRWSGWDGGELAGSQRLVDLSAIEGIARSSDIAGLADAAYGLSRRVATSPAPIALRVELLAPKDHFPAAIRDLLDALGAAGAAVIAIPAPATARVRALDRLRGDHAPDPVAPTSATDGSVVVLEGETPWEAGRLLAAWMRDHPATRTLIAPAEVDLLDRALSSAGMPSIGTSEASRWRPALQLLPLRLALLFAPGDPRAALDLLSLPIAPLPAATRARLRAALVAMPGIGGSDWERAVVASVAEATDAEALRAEIAAWFGGPRYDPYVGVPASTASRVCAIVADWLARTAEHVGPVEEPLLDRAASIAAELGAVLARQGDALIPRLQLEALHDIAVGAGALRTDRVAQVGRPAVVDAPSACLHPVDEVIWWGFVDGHVGRPSTDPWTTAERAVLAAAGVRLSPPGAARAREAWGWRQAAAAARERLVLVRWRVAGRDPTDPHPYEDEITARIGSLAPRIATARGGTGWRPATIAVPAAPPLRPRRLWHLGRGAIRPRAPIAAAEIDTLLACPLRWVLGDVAGWTGPSADHIADGPDLTLRLAHRLFREFLSAWSVGPSPTAEEVRAQVGASFERCVGVDAAPLMSPGRQIVRDGARRAITDAAFALASCLTAANQAPLAVGAATSGRFVGLAWRGRADLVVGGTDGRRAVVALTSVEFAESVRQLRDGITWQPALYATALATDGGPLPELGLFAISGGRLAVTARGYGDAVVQKADSANAIVARAAGRWRDWWRGLDHGHVAARHTRDDRGLDSEWQDLVGEPIPSGPPAPCGACAYRVLCRTEAAS